MSGFARVKVSMEFLRQALEFPEDVNIHQAFMELYDYRDGSCTLIIEKPDFPKVDPECASPPLVDVVFTETPRKVDVDFRFPENDDE